MTDYTYVGPSGGDWNDPNNWASGPNNTIHGVPGGGDIAGLPSTDLTLNANGADVGGLFGLGDTVTGSIGVGTLAGVNFLDASVSAGQIAPVYTTGALYPAPVVISVENSVLVAGSLTISEADAAEAYGAFDEAPVLGVTNSSATIGATTDAYGEIAAKNSQLTFQGALTISNGGGLNLSGGTTTISDLSLAGAAGLIDNGGTVTISEFSASGTYDSLTVQGGGTVNISGSASFNEFAVLALTVYQGSHLSVGGDLSLTNNTSLWVGGIQVGMEGPGSVAAANITVNNSQITLGVGGALTASGNVLIDTGGLALTGATAEIDGNLTLQGTTASFGLGASAQATIHGVTTVNLTAAQAGDYSGILLTGYGAAITFDGAVELGETGEGNFEVYSGDIAYIEATGLALQAGNAAILDNGTGLSVIGNTAIGDRGGQTATFNISAMLGATLGGSLTIGENGGTGTVTAGYGALHVAGGMVLGVATGSTGTLTAMGTNSPVTVQGSVTIGDGGTGTVTVQNGAGLWASGALTLGEQAGSQGTVTATGKGTRLFAGSDVTIGGAGMGTMAIRQGALFTATANATLGEKAHGYGSLTVSDAGTTGTIDGDLAVGNAGSGQLSVLNGGSLALGGALDVAESENAYGAVALDGANTVLTVSGPVTLGGSGAASVFVFAGAVFDASGSDVTIAEESVQFQATGGAKAPSADAVTVNAPGSALLAGSLTVGEGGTATIAVTAGGAVSAAADLTIGEQGSGKVTVENGTVSAGSLTIGSGAKGSLTVSGGVVSVGGDATLGEEAQGNGSLTLNVSAMAIGGTLSIAEAGSGTVIVGTSSVLSAGAIEIGGELGSKGSLTIDGPGSLVAGQDITVGAGGTASVKITDGGSLATTGDATIGERAIADVPAVSLNTGGSWNVTGNLTVGDGGLGQLSIAGTHSTVSVLGNVSVGGQNGGGGLLALGSSSAASSAALDWGGTLTVGDGGTGSLSIYAGDTAGTSAGGTGAIEVAAQTGSSGTVTVSGAGATLSGDTMTVGGSETAAGGAATVKASAGGSIHLGQSLTLWQGGTVSASASGGIITIGGGAAKSGAVAIGAAGQLVGAGTVSSGLVDGGLVEASGGKLTLKSGTLSGGGKVEIAKGATLNLSGSGAGDTIGTLTDYGYLVLGARSLTVTGAYANADWGTGDAFNPRAGVSGAAEIIGKGAALEVLGSAVSKGKNGLVLTFHAIAGGLEQASFTLENDGTGATITAAVETQGLKPADVSGVAAGNVTLARGKTSGVYTLTYNPAEGSLSGQTLKIVSDFGNVAPIAIGLAAASPLTVSKLSSSAGPEAGSGTVVPLIVQMSEAVTVGGIPVLDLNDGGVATYNAAASNPAAGTLVFDDTVASGDSTPDLEVAGLDLSSGATITGAGGVAANFAAAIGVGTGLQIGPAGVVSVSAAPAGEAVSGQTVKVTLALGEGVTVSGAPSLSLSDGATATYDAAASDPAAGTLVFDYTVGAADHSPDLAVTGVNLPAGTTIVDANGVAADFSAAAGALTGVQIGASPLTVTHVAASESGPGGAGPIRLTLSLSGAAIVNVSNGSPFLTLNDGATAAYDAGASNPAAGLLAFDYVPGSSDYTANLEIARVTLNGATVQNAAGYAANFAGALAVPTGVEVGAATVFSETAAPAGDDLLTGTVLTVTVSLDKGVTVTGLPSLTLSDGASATYDAALSNPAAGLLVFADTVAATDFTQDLQVTGVALNGGSVLDANGHPADLSGAVQELGRDVNAAVVIAVTAPQMLLAIAGQTVPLTIAMNEAVTVATAGGSPTLSLSDGGTASYDAASSDPSAGQLVFDYTIGAGQQAPSLAVAGLALNGATITGPAGHPADLSGIVGLSTGLQIGSPLTVKGLTVSPAGEADAGQPVRLTLQMSEAVTLDAVAGDPTLTLNDGATASFDAAASNLAAGTLVFDYTAGAADSTASLAVTAVNLPTGSTVEDANGENADFSAALNHSTGLQIGPAVVTGVTVSPSGEADAGEGVVLTLALDAGVTVDIAGGRPSLTLSDGATAAYNVAASTATKLVFDDIVGKGYHAANLAIAAVNLNGATITDASGQAANLAAALNQPTGLQIGPAYVTALAAGQTGDVFAGYVVSLTMTLSQGVTVDTAGGTPSLTLNDGGTAVYEALDSFPSSGTLVFSYTVGTTDETPDLTVKTVNLNGATVTDPQGHAADLSGAVGIATGVSVGEPPVVTGVTASAAAAEIGDTITLTVTLSEAVFVSGTPTLILSNGATASYSSTTATGLTFSYTVAAGDAATADLSVVQVSLNGATVQNDEDLNANLSAADNAATGLSVDTPLTVSAVTASASGEVDSGTVKLTLELSQPFILDTAGGLPTVTLDDGATATYDAAASKPAQGMLVFDYTIAAGDQTADLVVTAVNLPAGASVTDAAGYNADFAAALDAPTGLQIGPSYVAAVSAAPLGEVAAGQTVEITLAMSAAVTVTGAPELRLGDGATASYDAAQSSATALVFDYTVGAGNQAAMLQIDDVALNGGTITDAHGVAANLAGAVGAYLAVVVGPAFVTGVTASASGEVDSGTVELTLAMSNAVTVSGAPTLTLSDGATATYDSAASNAVQLVFDYTIGTTDRSPDLAVTKINLNGATVTDFSGASANLTNAAGLTTGLQIGPTPLTVSSVAASTKVPVRTGQLVRLTLGLSQAVTVDTAAGSPSLQLNDGGVATYDAAASNPAAGLLRFDYTVGAGEATTNLAVTQVDLNGATIEDALGYGANFSGAIDAPTGLEVTPLVAQLVQVSPGQVAETGTTVHLTLVMSEPVILDTAGGTPRLVLSDGATALYDAATSDPAGGLLVFDYQVGAADRAANLTVTAVDLDGATVQDSAGYSAVFTGVIKTPTGLQIGPSPLTVASVAAAQAGEVDAAGKVQITLTMSEAVTLDTAGGLPTLLLNDGGIATLDTGASSPSSGILVFDYTVAAKQEIPNLAVVGVQLPSPSAIRDANGYEADLSTAFDVPLGLQIGPAFVTSVAASPSDTTAPGDLVQLFVFLSGGVTVSGVPTLKLSDGGVATYKAAASDPAAGTLVFDYVVGLADSSPDLAVTAVTLPSGASVQDVHGSAVDFSAALNAPTGLVVIGAPHTSWTGNTGDWSDAADWTGGIPNGVTFGVSVGLSSAYTLTVGSGESYTAGTLIVSDAKATIDLLGALTLAGSGSALAAPVTGSGTLTEDGTLTNRSTISLTGGISLAAGAAMTNSGVIDGHVTLAGGSLTNTAGASIAATSGAAIQGDGTVTNAGTITGSGAAVTFGSGDDELIVTPGAHFVGTVEGGGVDSTLELAAGAGAGVLNALGTEFTQFGVVTVASGASWTVDTLAATLGFVTLTGNNTASRLVLTSSGPANLGGVSDFGTITLAAGGNSVTVTDASLSGGALTIDAGASGGNTVDAAGDSIASVGKSLTYVAGSGKDVFEGGHENDTVRVTAAALGGDTLTGGSGSNTLAITTAGAAGLGGVRGFEKIVLPGSGLVTLSLTDANFVGVAASTIAVSAGSAGDTVTAAAVTALDTIVFNAGGGSDTIAGGQGDNIYRFASAANATLGITNAFAGGTAAHGELAFASGVDQNDLWFLDSSNNLVAEVIGTSKEATVNGWFGSNPSAQLKEIVAGNGMELDTQVAQLVAAMATYSANNPAFNPTASGATMPNDPSLQSALASAWHSASSG